MRRSIRYQGAIAHALTIAAICLSAAADCATSTSPSQQLVRFRNESVAFLIHSGLSAAANIVITDAAAWDKLWKEMHRNVSPVPPLPAVDFTNEIVVGRAMGERPTGGHNVVLTGATRSGGGVVVAVRETRPGSNCMVTQAITAPVDLARLPRPSGPVTFKISQGVTNCG